MTGADNQPSVNLRVLSLGAGVQSTTVLLMALAGELPPLDAAIFADTGWEPPEVYAHLDKLRQLCADAKLPLITVTQGNLRDEVMGGGFRSIPSFILNADGSAGIGRRQCTHQFKLRPVRRQLRTLLADAGVKVADLWMGISLDEVHRMRTADVRYQHNVYPLVDRRMTRHDCQLWLAAHGWAAPRSACVGCPYHSDREWRAIKADPVTWADAVEVDHRIRETDRLRGTEYLHSSLVPLDEVDLSTPEDHGQLSMFGAECEGMCGL